MKGISISVSIADYGVIKARVQLVARSEISSARARTRRREYVRACKSASASDAWLDFRRRCSAVYFCASTAPESTKLYRRCKHRQLHRDTGYDNNNNNNNNNTVNGLRGPSKVKGHDMRYEEFSVSRLLNNRFEVTDSE
jgi:hypothetical protein